MKEIKPENPDELLLNDSFVRWARETADEQEHAFWEDWVHRNPENRKMAAEARQMLLTMQFREADTSDMETELARLNDTLDDRVDKQQPKPRVRQPVLGGNVIRYAAAAAIVLLALVGGYILLGDTFGSSSGPLAQHPVPTKVTRQVVRQDAQAATEPDSKNRMITVATEYAQQKTLILQDGTRVVLNAQSTLRYPSDYTGDGDVKVHLQGEAYFEVAKDLKKERTFTVQTKDGDVSVLGTKFSVQTRSSQTKVALKEGVVEVQVNRDGHQHARYRMQPGELARFSHSSSSIRVAEINPEVYTSWASANLRFDNTSLRQVVWRIKQTYGINVVVRDSTLMGKKISGSIQNNDLDVLLKALSKLLHTNVERKKTSVVIGH